MKIVSRKMDIRVRVYWIVVVVVQPVERTVIWMDAEKTMFT